MQARRRPNFLYLMAGLLTVLVGAPVVYELTHQSMPLISQVALSLTLLLGIWSLVEKRKWFIAGISLVATDAVLTVIYLSTGSWLAETITICLELSFCTLSIVFALDYVLLSRKMDVNRIVGAICVYMLLGLILGLTNMLIYRLIPGSFNGLDVGEAELEGFSLIYYSFVTMTTLGYGDITPAGALARSLAYVAAIMGQFYIAILVAMVVAQYINEKNEARRDEQ